MSSVEWAQPGGAQYFVAKLRDGWTVTVAWSAARDGYSWLVVDSKRGAWVSAGAAMSLAGAKKAGLIAQGEAAKLPRPLPNDEIVCGSASGYRRHYRAKTAVCTPCRDAHNAEQRERAAREKAAGRARVRAPKPKPKAKAKPTTTAGCGSNAGWEAHRRRGEESCDPCRLAHNKYVQEHRLRRRSEAKPTTAAA